MSRQGVFPYLVTSEVPQCTWLTFSWPQAPLCLSSSLIFGILLGLSFSFVFYTLSKQKEPQPTNHFQNDLIPSWLSIKGACKLYSELQPFCCLAG